MPAEGFAATLCHQICNNVIAIDWQDPGNNLVTLFTVRQSLSLLWNEQRG